MTSIETSPEISRRNVGQIAERIVSNELEYRGFRVSDLNHDGLSANADLLAAGYGQVWQIQVKGATNAPSDKQWWVQYGYCTDDIIRDTKQQKHHMFNRRTSFYTAEVVVLVAVRRPSEYKCVVLTVKAAERAVQINLNRGYRKGTRKGTRRKPGKVWAYLEPSPREHKLDQEKRDLRVRERAILTAGLDAWDILYKPSAR